MYNPGDQPAKNNLISNQMLQNRINSLFPGLTISSSTPIPILPRINNGVYALMDIKSHNVDRLVALHNIISEGIHKVEHMEERVDALVHRFDESGRQEKHQGFSVVSKTG